MGNKWPLTSGSRIGTRPFSWLIAANRAKTSALDLKKTKPATLLQNNVTLDQGCTATLDVVLHHRRLLSTTDAPHGELRRLRVLGVALALSLDVQHGTPLGEARALCVVLVAALAEVVQSLCVGCAGGVRGRTAPHETQSVDCFHLS
jgi:hypothetical protein